MVDKKRLNRQYAQCSQLMVYYLLLSIVRVSAAIIKKCKKKKEKSQIHCLRQPVKIS